ncbi:acyl carrier protein [Streptomyces sp. RKND-216]|uniref:acyl carrier protein n=1 Tax=Streptomyces sp. RKND-216 TaxID=2562581 RepID=UPI001FF76099
MLSAHGLDSMGVFGLITDLEEAYALTLPDEAVVPANFATPRTVWDMLLPLVPLGHDEPAG